MTTIAVAEQRRLEQILGVILREAAKLQSRVFAREELDELVPQEAAILAQGFGPEFLVRLLRELPAALPGEERLSAVFWTVRLARANEEHLRMVGASAAHYLLAMQPRWTPLTFADRRHRLDAFARIHADRLPATLTPQEIVEHLLRWPSASTRSPHWSTLNGYFNWLVERREIPQNPVPLACPRPRPTFRPRLIFTPEQTRNLLQTVKSTDQAGFWVLALFAGLRTAEIRRLHRNPDPWQIIQLRRRRIDLRSDPHARTRRVVPLLPGPHAWLSWVKRHAIPLFPVYHQRKIYPTQSATLGLPATEVLRSHAMARRSFISYRLALGDLTSAEISDCVGSREKFLKLYFDARATRSEAEQYFAFTPKSIGMSPTDTDSQPSVIDCGAPCHPV